MFSILKTVVSDILSDIQLFQERGYICSILFKIGWQWKSWITYKLYVAGSSYIDLLGGIV